MKERDEKEGRRIEMKERDKKRHLPERHTQEQVLRVSPLPQRGVWLEPSTGVLTPRQSVPSPASFDPVPLMPCPWNACRRTWSAGSGRGPDGDHHELAHAPCLHFPAHWRFRGSASFVPTSGRDPGRVALVLTFVSETSALATYSTRELLGEGA